MAKTSKPTPAGVPVAGLSDDRRQGSRKSVIDVELVTVDLGEHKGALLLDLSETGIGVQTLSGADLGASTPISFELPESKVRIQAKGSVAWFDSSGRAGVRFLDLTHKDRELVRDWLSHGSTGMVAEEPPMSLTGTPAIDPAAEIELLETEIVAGKLSNEAALAAIVQRTGELTRAMGAAIAIDDGTGMICRASVGVAPQVGVRLQPDAGLSGECVRSGEIVRCEDTETDPRADRVLCRRINLRSVVILPMHSGKKVAGLIEVFSSLPHAFDSADIILLRHVVSLVAALTETEAHSQLAPSRSARHPEIKPAATAASETKAPAIPPKPPAAPAPAAEKPKPVVEAKPDLSATLTYDATALASLVEKMAAPSAAPVETPKPAPLSEPVKATAPQIVPKIAPKVDAKTEPAPKPEVKTAPVSQPTKSTQSSANSELAAAPPAARQEKQEKKDAKSATIVTAKPLQPKLDPAPSKPQPAAFVPAQAKPVEKPKVAEIPAKPAEKLVATAAKAKPVPAKSADTPSPASAPATGNHAAAAVAPAKIPDSAPATAAKPKPVIGSAALVCDSCGYSNPKTALTCERCDVPLSMNYSPSFAEPGRKLIVPPSFSAAGETSRSTLIRIAVAALAVIAIGGGTWATVHYKSQPVAAKSAVAASQPVSATPAPVSALPGAIPAPPPPSAQVNTAVKTPVKTAKSSSPYVAKDVAKTEPRVAAPAAAQPAQTPAPQPAAIEIQPPAPAGVDSPSDAPPPVVDLKNGSSPLAALPPAAVAIPQRANPGRVSEGRTGGKLLRRVEPAYPQMARSLGLQGIVTLRATITKSGDVRNVQAVSGPSILAAAAVSAVRRWKYEPVRLNGEIVEVETDIQVNFTLPR